MEKEIIKIQIVSLSPSGSEYELKISKSYTKYAVCSCKGFAFLRQKNASALCRHLKAFFSGDDSVFVILGGDVEEIETAQLNWANNNPDALEKMKYLQDKKKELEDVQKRIRKVKEEREEINKVIKKNSKELSKLLGL